MRTLITILFSGFLLNLSAQTTVFSDNFESNNSKWTKTGTWGLTGAFKHGGSKSMTDSPSSMYANNTLTSITMSSGVALDSCLDAELSFWAIYDIETGFDYCYVDVSSDNWSTYTRIATFNGENKLSPWVKYTYSLGGFIGKTNVKMRFLLYTDQGYVVDGIYIDDLKITKDTVDKSPPLIVHIPKAHYEASLTSQYLTADIIDTSGVGLAELTYMVDGGTPVTINGVNTFGDEYAFTIPPQAAGSWVDYYITAADTALVPNVAVTDTFKYISGNHIFYDNAVVSFVSNFGPSGTNGDAIAVRITFPGTTQLVTALIRNYTDVNNPNDSIDVHVWEDSSGVPGTDIIPPVRIFPEATLVNTNPMTRVDLRSLATSLSNLSGDIFIGYTVPSGRAWTSYTSGTSANRSFIKTSGTWTQLTGNDYHFRAVTDYMSGAPLAGFTTDTTGDPTISFTDTSLNSPTTWWWEFGDGQVDSVQNPSHTYGANGSYQVCLTITNNFGTDKVCKIINIHEVSPIADFSFNAQNDPSVDFTDLSRNNPTNWEWNFGDGSPISTAQFPTHVFDSNITYQVCLKAYNSIGADSTCQNVTIKGYKIPVADFSFEITSVGVVQFSDSSTNNPSAWQWAFGNGKSDSIQHPLHTYTKNQKFIVCLVASTGAGKSAPVCKEVSIKYIGIDGEDQDDQIRLYPNPANDQFVFDPGNLNQGTIVIQSINGSEVYRSSFNGKAPVSINIDWLESGQYLFMIQSDKTYIRKLVVE